MEKVKQKKKEYVFLTETSLCCFPACARWRFMLLVFYCYNLIHSAI